MDAIVTARVPVEIKDQVSAILAEMGSSPTKLINAAYEYVMRTRELPRASDAPSADTPVTVRRLTAEQRSELEAALDQCTLDIPQSFWDELGDRSYKEAIADWRWEDYAALS